MPEALLLDGERLLFVTRRHLNTLVLPLLFISGSVLLLLGQGCPAAVELHLDGRCPLVVGVVLVVASLPFILDWWTTRFILTDQRLLVVRRPVWRQLRSLPLGKIESLSLHVGLLGGLLGYGDVIVDSAATHADRLVLGFVPEPEQVRRQIAAALAGCREE